MVEQIKGNAIEPPCAIEDLLHDYLGRSPESLPPMKKPLGVKPRYSKYAYWTSMSHYDRGGFKDESFSERPKYTQTMHESPFSENIVKYMAVDNFKRLISNGHLFQFQYEVTDLFN